MRQFLDEFKTFAVRGNAIDLAVGIVIGAAFGQITNSLVTNILTPLIGRMLGGFDFSTLAIPLGGEAVIQYGVFLQSILNFVIIAFALFLMVKGINRLKSKQKEEEKKAEPTPDQKLLAEIRDVLKERKV